MNRKLAEKLNRLATELEKEGKLQDAIATYKKAIEADPGWAISHYNLGLLFKRERNWEESYFYNEIAARLDSEDKATWWNMGIAATALTNWEKARFAWRKFGIQLPPENETEEIRMKVGITPIRLSENGEVVWAERIDPARAIILNIPTPESKRRYHDMILNDGAPNGGRIVNGTEYPVFDEIELIKSSEFQTYSIWIEAEDKTLIQLLEEQCDDKGLVFENWTTSIRYICSQCSQGIPHEKHDKNLEQTTPEKQYQIAIATLSYEDLSKLLAIWTSKTIGKVIDIERLM